MFEAGIRAALRTVSIAVLIAAGHGPAARGQDFEDDAPEPVPPEARNEFVLNAQQFDQWVFGNSNVQGAPGARKKMDTMLSLQIEEMDRTCGLSDSQKEKLRLAGRGDVERFFDRVEEKRRELQDKSYEQNKIGELYQQLQPFQATLNGGLFDDGSLFEKIVAKALDPEQAARYESFNRERRTFRYRAKVEMMVLKLSRSLGLRAEQQERFVQAIIEETRPPRRFGQNDYYLVLYQASTVPEERLRPIFDEAQWGLIQRLLRQGKGYEQFLKTGGYVADAEEGGDDSVAKEEAKR
jgi:hypothetical protein